MALHSAVHVARVGQLHGLEQGGLRHTYSCLLLVYVTLHIVVCAVYRPAVKASCLADIHACLTGLQLVAT